MTSPKWRKTDEGFRSDDGYRIVYVGQTWSTNRAMYNLYTPDGNFVPGAIHASLADVKALTVYYRNNPQKWGKP